ncbi:MAG: hypothetical protein NTY19_08145 [Planctomycetota bacterium]|nr:hypothetical protein [Planctomycetota bacterium]
MLTLLLQFPLARQRRVSFRPLNTVIAKCGFAEPVNQRASFSNELRSRLLGDLGLLDSGVQLPSGFPRGLVSHTVTVHLFADIGLGSTQGSGQQGHTGHGNAMLD